VGVVRIVIEKKLPLALGELLGAAASAFGQLLPVGDDDAGGPSWRAALQRFLGERLNTYLRADLQHSAAEVDATLEVDAGTWTHVVPRLHAVRVFAGLPEAPALAAANKRVGNILKKVEGVVEAKIDAALLTEPAEAALASALATVGPEADAAFARGDYTASLQGLAALKEPVDAFFEHVMVNVDDERLRANRLGLLATLHAAMNRVADLSKLAA
jgi:glycyl-tRNA synthetase beta chain